MSLRSFIGQMENESEVLHIRDEVLAKFEISRVIKDFDNEGPVLFFEKLKDHGRSVVANVCGTRRRIFKALDVPENQFYQRLLWAWRNPSKPKVAREASALETVEKKVDLSKIPILTHFERDAGPYITAGVVHARSADETVENLSVHRLQVLDEDHLAIRLVPRHLHKLWSDFKSEGRDLDVAISIGVHPAILFAASSPVPFGVNEFDVASTLMDSSLKLVECKNVNACAPVDAELVLEGKISATKKVAEGPFVDITGTYDIQREQPVVDIVGFMRRNDYIYQALLPSGAEHKLLMGLPHEALIWESVSKVVPKVHAVNLSAGGNGWLHAIISIEKQVDGDAKNALLAAFAGHPSLKHAIVVNADIDVYDLMAVEWAVATRFQASEDLVVIGNARGSTLDGSADQETGLTSKMGVDATIPLAKPAEKFVRARIPSSKHVEDLLLELRRM